MIRRDQQQDGSVIVWSEHRVMLYDADGQPAERRPLTDAEASAFAAWVATQPGGSEWAALRRAAAETAITLRR